MSTPLTNVLLIGATGSLGTPILEALLAHPNLTVTILTRTNSSANFPPNIPIKHISPSYPLSELTSAFKGHDAVISAISTTPASKDDLSFRIVDAALAAGVKRLIPSEFGANNLDPRARALVPVYDRKGAMLEYLQQQAEASDGRFTWTSVSCGSWLDWALSPIKSGNFLDVDVAERKAVVWDSGTARFSATTSANTGRAVVQILLRPEGTANRQVFLSDFVTTPRAVIAALEAHTGAVFAVEERESAPVISEARRRFDEGEFEATYTLLKMSFVGDVDVGYDFPAEQRIWNAELGLPERTLGEVVKGVVEGVVEGVESEA